MKKALSTSEAAAFLGTTPGMLRLARHTGELYKGVPGPKFYKLGKRKVAYPIEELNAWLEGKAIYRNTAEYFQEGCE